MEKTPCLSSAPKRRLDLPYARPRVALK